MTRPEAGQAAIETVFVVPLCVLCAVALVSAGSYVRGQLAVQHAAARAGAAAVRGEDVDAAGRAALPAGLRHGASVTRQGNVVRVRIRARGGMLTPLLPAHQSSKVVVA